MDFFPPHANNSGGWIIVEPLASKPLGVAVDTWLAELSDGANQNTHVLEERLVIDGQPALRVRYRTAQGEFMEAVYVMVGQKTISIGFNGQSFDPADERLSNYRVYSEMLRSFRVAKVPTPKHVRP